MQFGERKSGIYYKNRKAIYAVIVDKQTQKVAVMLHNHMGFLPGGGLKGSETIVEGLKRECIEETGFTLNIEKYIGNAKQYFQTRQMEYILNDGYYYIGSFGKKISKPVDDDHVLEWMDYDQVMEKILHETHKWAVQEAFKMHVKT